MQIIVLLLKLLLKIINVRSQTFEAEIPGQGLVQVTVPVDSIAGETIEIEVPCMDNAQDSHARESAIEISDRDTANRGGTVSFREYGDGLGSPSEEFESLSKSNAMKAGRTRGSLPHTNLPDKTEEIKAKFRRGSSSSDPAQQSPIALPDGGYGNSSPIKLRAGAESLGATKAPDWTKYVKEGNKEKLSVGNSGESWRVYLNDEVKNFQEQNQAKQQGTLVAKNSVSTSKYTFYNFLFLNLGQQFSRLANCYFMVIAVLQLFTKLSPTGRFSTAAPLSLVRVLLSGAYILST